MRSKSPLVLIEQMLMLLVFAIAAAVCVRAFVWAEERSEFNSDRSYAAVYVQSAAETVKACRGDLTRAAGLLENCAVEGGVLTQTVDGCTVRVTLAAEDDPLTGRADVSAVDEDGAELLSVSVAWQEVAE